MKRLFTTLIFLQVIACVGQGQDCVTLNKFNSYRGIEFGLRISDEIKKDFLFKVGNGMNDTTFKLFELKWQMVETDNNYYSKYFKLFQFGGVLFSNLNIYCLPDGRVYDIEVNKAYNRNGRNDIAILEDSVEIMNKRWPKSFIKIYDELVSLFGSPTKEETTDDLLGRLISRIWLCDKKKIELRLRYNYNPDLMFSKFTLLIGLTITDNELQKEQKLKSYMN